MTVRYWIYTGTPGVAKIHRSTCGHCLDGKGGGQKAEHIGDYWYGSMPLGCRSGHCRSWRVGTTIG